MPGIFDMLNAAASPQMTALFLKLPSIFDDWLIQLRAMKSGIDRANDRVETIDNKINYLCDTASEVSDKLTLLLSESIITPELHADVLLMAVNDPRNPVRGRFDG